MGVVSHDGLAEYTGDLALQVVGLKKEYAAAGGGLCVLDGVDLELERGQAAAIMGPSGSGKSTLLHILGTLDTPTAGTIRLDGRDPFSLETKQLAAYRNSNVGFVFQDHCLLPQLSVIENVLTPTLVGAAAPQAEQRARMLIERVGLGPRISHRPAELSGGEKQRAAIARALIREPKLVLCDEPTGNLDQQSANAVAKLLLELHQAEQTILIVVTHSVALAEMFPRRFQMAGGRLIGSI